jgi:hypothetical protein
VGDNEINRDVSGGAVQAQFLMGNVNIYAKRRRRRWLAIAMVIAAVGAAGIGARLALNRPGVLSASAEYQPLLETPEAVFPQPLGRNEFPNNQSCRSVVDWALARGGVYASYTPVRLTLSTNGGSVLVNKIAVQVTERSEAPAGTLFTCGGAGQVSPVQLNVNLDEEIPVVRKTKSDGSPGGIYSQDTVITLNNETITFDISPATTRYLCRWRIEIGYIKDGEPATMTVTTPDKQDFQTAATNRVKRAYTAVGGSNIWGEAFTAENR